MTARRICSDSTNVAVLLAWNLPSYVMLAKWTAFTLHSARDFSGMNSYPGELKKISASFSNRRPAMVSVKLRGTTHSTMNSVKTGSLLIRSPKSGSSIMYQVSMRCGMG